MYDTSRPPSQPFSSDVIEWDKAEEVKRRLSRLWAKFHRE